MTPNLNDTERSAIEMAAAGCVSGTLSEWPVLQSALRKLGYVFPTTATAAQVRDTCCNHSRLDKLNEWTGLTDAGLRLRCGELTAGEIRAIRAVLNALS